jgi:cystathionine beta-lyase
MIQNFDEIIKRTGTNCTKFDGRMRFFGTQNITPLWVADMDFATPQFITDAISNKINQIIFGYEEINDEWFEAIINWQKRNGLKLYKSEIAFSPSVVSSLIACVNAFSSIGDEIIVQSPVYYPFYSVVKDNNRQVIINNLQEINGKYFFDLEDLKSKISSKTKMIFVCSPHNPVGRVWTIDELQDIINIAKKSNILIVFDEIHSDLSYVHFESGYGFDYENILVLNSPSKAFNTAGLNSSYVFGKNKQIITTFKKTAKALGFAANNFAYISTISAYKNGDKWIDDLKKYLQKNIQDTITFFEANSMKIKAKHPDATYLMWLDFRETNIDPNELNKILINECKLGLNDGISFGENGKGFMRLNIATPNNNLKNALKNFRLIPNKHF